MKANEANDAWSYSFTSQSVFILWYLLEQKQKTLYCS